MVLSDYDDLCVRIVLTNGECFEGACQYNNQEFNEIELGIDEESLNITGWLFRRSDIAEIIVIDEDHPYLAPYGRPEREAVEDALQEDDLYWIDDKLFTDEPRNIVRMLACLDDCLKGDFRFRNEVLDMLEKLIPYAEDEEVTKEARRLLDEYK